ncbi:MAG: M67 family metallopeptidase [Ardenticatenia bacterium]|nr:M67 family metallopeptidase [Ardenticatenia bacterium]
MSRVVELPRTVAEKMIAHARAGKPEEVCGLVAADDTGHIVKVIPVANAAEHKIVTYYMDPVEQYRAFKAIEEEGLELFGIYHSHPATEAYPSATDRRLAFDHMAGTPLYPGAVYFIISLADEQNPIIRAFRLPDADTVEELDVRLV